MRNQSVYVHNRQSHDGVLAQGADQRVSKSMIVVYEMVKLLASWTYR